jgi:hypothetical protein
MEGSPHKKYIHIVKKLGWIRISIFKLGSKFTFRFEVSKGWEQ